MAEKFDFEAALKAVQSGQSISGKDGVLGPLVRQLTEAALEGELESHLTDEVADNGRNGKSRKTVETHQRTVSDEIESSTLSMYGLGMSYSDIAGHVEQLYGIHVSTAAINTITDKAHRRRKSVAGAASGERISVRLDAIHYKIRDKGRYETRDVYPLLALNMEGEKEVLMGK